MMKNLYKVEAGLMKEFFVN